MPSSTITVVRISSGKACLVDETVLGDTLINAIDQHGSGNPTALQPYFPTAAMGTLGILAQKLHSFLAVEKELAALQSKVEEIVELRGGM